MVMAKSELQSGDFKQRVTFYSSDLQEDASGGSRSNWVEEFSSMAHVIYMHGGEAVIAAGLQGKRPVVLTIRRSKNSNRITSHWKVVFDGVDYNIREKPKPTSDPMNCEFKAVAGVAVGN